MAATVRWEFVGDWAAVLFEGRPADDDFAAWLRVYPDVIGRLRGMLVYARGGGPDAAQRSQLSAITQQREATHATAIVTDSRLMRSAVAAFNWFLPAHAQKGVVFAPDQLDRAFQHLKVPREERSQLETAVAELLGRPLARAQPVARARAMTHLRR